MTKRIININNSFTIYQNTNISIWMDPWVNTANEGAWAGLLDQNEQYLLSKGVIFSLPDIISRIYIAIILTINFLS